MRRPTPSRRLHRFADRTLRSGAALCLALAWNMAAAQAAAPASAPSPAQPAAAQTAPQPANEQVIVPQVDRRNVKVPRLPSKDIEIGLFYGTYATQNFGAHGVAGVRLGYHLSEDFFVQTVYGRTQADDKVYRRLNGGIGGVFSNGSDTTDVNYYNLSVGFNVLPGEFFIGRRYAMPAALYLIAGVGSTRFNELRNQTLNFGWGARFMLADWAALQVDMRDHVYSVDLLGRRESTHNIEMSAGLSFFF
jgi:outer membrane beta-barrel protein